MGFEERFVAHFLAFFNQIAQIDIGQTHLPRLLNLPQHIVGAKAALGIGVKEGVNGGESIVQDIQNRDHLKS